MKTTPDPETPVWFRSIPVVLQAKRFNPDLEHDSDILKQMHEIAEWLGSPGTVKFNNEEDGDPIFKIFFTQPHAILRITPGDWIVSGDIPGRWQVMDDESFRATYQPVPEDDPMFTEGEPCPCL